MSSPHVSGLAALLLLGAVSGATAQDVIIVAPAGQSGAPAGAPKDPRPPSDGGAREAAPGQDQSAARVADDQASQDLDRARDAARKADPRLLGLERARDAARKADASGGVDCLSARDARNTVTAKRAVTLSQALRTARAAWDGEVIDYRLCTFDGALAYDLTLLNAEGRVARVRVDAADGKLVSVR